MNVPEEVDDRLTDLETRRALAEMNAERLEDMDDPACAEEQRQKAARLYREYVELVEEHGIDLNEDNF
ncbi:hypothetical protein [Curtobacterium sp. S6]|uniref:hypothetical protein n=1 Tax=Curtobacterium sp. S6 TaxID=1479623 RepID=UPI0004ABB1AE|nr:hypothetical protein [Curtobacterium sp. S6]